MSLQQALSVRNIFRVLILLSIVISIVLIYVASERTFYWTDYVVYQNRAAEVIVALRESPTLAIQQISDSLSGDYNKLYVIPLVPFLAIFGNSRTAYILSVAIAYLLPFCGAIGLIATQLYRNFPSFSVFWRTAFLTLLVPMSWIPTLRGFPDTVGMLCVTLAGWVYLGKRRWWTFPVMGLLLAWGVLFRRHFAYGGLAIVGSIVLLAIWDLVSSLLSYFQSPDSRKVSFQSSLKSSLKRCIHHGIELGLIGVSGFVVLSIVASEFTQRALTGNYREAYSSFSFPIPDTIEYFGAAYGFFTWGLAIWGFWRGWKLKTFDRSSARFILLWGILAVFFQIFVLRYDSVHYTLHVTPFIVLGLSSFFIPASTQKSRHNQNFVILAYLIVNTIFGLTPMGTWNVSGRTIFAINHSPLVRRDYDELVSLIQYLHQLTPNREPIHLISVSDTLNRGLIRNADWELFPPETVTTACHIPCGLNILALPTADSNSIYPLEALLQAQYVVIAHPLQYHLQLDEQEVVKVAYQVFEENWEIAEDFEKRPENFLLEHDIIVSVYQRIQPTSWETAVRTLAKMEQTFIDRPGLQSNWVNLNPEIAVRGQYSGDETPTLEISNLSRSLRLLYIGELQDSIEFSSHLTSSDNCKISANLSLIDKAANLVSFQNTVTEQPLKLYRNNAAYLLLSLTPDERKTCSVELGDVTVK
ncbi:MAG: hypothetical protein J7641_23385 [Cyanobacteria bacterium SID2]|nr:hypothetical protein [Cyanobacteria bacterium SID2]